MILSKKIIGTINQFKVINLALPLILTEKLLVLQYPVDP